MNTDIMPIQVLFIFKIWCVYLTSSSSVMHLKDLKVTEDMIDGIADSTFINEGGYKVLTKEEVKEILRESL